MSRIRRAIQNLLNKESSPPANSDYLAHLQLENAWLRGLIEDLKNTPRPPAPARVREQVSYTPKGGVQTRTAARLQIQTYLDKKNQEKKNELAKES